MLNISKKYIKKFPKYVTMNNILALIFKKYIFILHRIFSKFFKRNKNISNEEQC